MRRRNNLRSHDAPGSQVDRAPSRAHSAHQAQEGIDQSSKSRTQGEATNNRNQSGGSEMELRETTIGRLRKRLGRDPTEEEIKAERDRKWRFTLADMGITAEGFLDEEKSAGRLPALRGMYRGAGRPAPWLAAPSAPPEGPRTQRVWHRRTNVWR